MTARLPYGVAAPCEPQSLEVIVAGRVRELRSQAGVTQDDLARACQRAGLGWRTSRVGQLETSRVTIAPGVLIGLARAFAEVFDRDFAIAELIPEDANVLLAESLVVTGEALRAVFSGEPLKAPRPRADLPRLDPCWGQVEDHVAACLAGSAGAPSRAADECILATARSIFDGRSGTEERDRRAGVSASPQKRGRMTRTLANELLQQIEIRRGAANSSPCLRSVGDAL